MFWYWIHNMEGKILKSLFGKERHSQAKLFRNKERERLFLYSFVYLFIYMVILSRSGFSVVVADVPFVCFDNSLSTKLLCLYNRSSDDSFLRLDNAINNIQKMHKQF